MYDFSRQEIGRRQEHKLRKKSLKPDIYDDPYDDPSLYDDVSITY